MVFSCGQPEGGYRFLQPYARKERIQVLLIGGFCFVAQFKGHHWTPQFNHERVTIKKRLWEGEIEAKLERNLNLRYSCPRGEIRIHCRILLPLVAISTLQNT